MSPPIATSRMAPIMPNPRKESRRRLNHSAARAELPVVRHLIRARRAGVLTVAATAGALAVAGPAMAGVSVSPPSAPQTAGADLTFHVTNTEQSAITRVKVSLPADTPIAEVYPLSSPDWAPDITQQKLSTPLTSIHDGTPVTEATKDITWIAITGKSIAPGRSADLSVSLGPLPTLSQMQFTVVPTYADGHAGPAEPPVVLKLTPATAADQAAAHAGHVGTTATTGTGTGTDSSDPEAALFAQTVAQAEHGPSIWSIGGWVVAGLVGLGAIVAALRSRRRRDEPAPAEADETGQDGETGDTDKEPVGAGTRKSSNWRYRDDASE
jgi:uncharacterized protein DUF1775